MTKLDKLAYKIYLELEEQEDRPILSEDGFLYHTNFTKKYYNLARIKQRKQKLEKLNESKI